MAEPEAKTINGHLRGLKQTSIEGFDFYAFKGIPYAKPPVGELRFKVRKIQTFFTLQENLIHQYKLVTKSCD